MCVDNCCERVWNLGCADCGPTLIELPVLAAQTGVYVARFKYLGNEIQFNAAGTVDTPIMVGVTGLNEEFVYFFYVLDPDGERVTYTADGLTYDCFSIKFTPCVIGEEYTPPAGECEPVEIIDQNDNVLAEVPAGEQYEVFVLDEINDEEPYDTPLEIDDSDG